MDWFWWLIIGVFIGGLSVLFLMSMLHVASASDDLLLGSRQYDEE